MFFPRTGIFEIRQSVGYFGKIDDMKDSDVYLATDADSFAPTGPGRSYPNIHGILCWQSVASAPDYAAAGIDRQNISGFSLSVSQ